MHSLQWSEGYFVIMQNLGYTTCLTDKALLTPLASPRWGGTSRWRLSAARRTWPLTTPSARILRKWDSIMRNKYVIMFVNLEQKSYSLVLQNISFLSKLSRGPSARRPRRPTCTRASSRWTSTPRRSSPRRPTGPTSTPSPWSGSGTRPAASPPLVSSEF